MTSAGPSVGPTNEALRLTKPAFFSNSAGFAAELPVFGNAEA
jgi:hypothetical protein